MRETTLCYILRGDQVLMLHRTKKKNDLNHDKWIGVGGHLEPGLDEKWRAFLNLRRDFERRMGASVYSLFDECAAVTFAAEG